MTTSNSVDLILAIFDDDDDDACALHPGSGHFQRLQFLPLELHLRERPTEGRTHVPRQAQLGSTAPEGAEGHGFGRRNHGPRHLPQCLCHGPVLGKGPPVECTICHRALPRQFGLPLCFLFLLRRARRSAGSIRLLDCQQEAEQSDPFLDLWLHFFSVPRLRPEEQLNINY